MSQVIEPVFLDNTGQLIVEELQNLVNVIGGIPMLTQSEWDALSISEKQSYGLVNIKTADSGFVRGKLVNGADYITLLPNSASANVLAEALSTKYIAGEMDLGGITIHGTPVIQSNGALRMAGSTAYADYPDNAGQAMTIYGVLSGYGSDSEWGRVLSLAYASSTQNEATFAYRSGKKVWYACYNVMNINTGLASNEKHIFAISVDASKNVRFYIDGEFLGTATLNNIGYARWTYGANADYQNADFYYGAVVKGQESDATIIANMQNIMTYYGIN